jgi:hydroxymethylpyrimidine pyrophosphatase-like HAD family hydrolase
MIATPACITPTVHGLLNEQGMKLRLLALDYDGTIAENGELDAVVRSALIEACRADIRLVLATGRNLGDLRRLPCGLELFDAVVAENGAVLNFPATGRTMLLAEPPERIFLQELTRRNIPFLAGACLIEIRSQYAERVVAAIRELELPLVVAFNRERAMVLPEAVTKGKGLIAAAHTLRVSLHNAVAIGDAQNDHDLLRSCEIGIAVSWGSPSLHRAADEIVEGGSPAAVAAVIRSLISQPILHLNPDARRRPLYLGVRPSGEALSLAGLGRNVFIVGHPQSGKSRLTALLCEQLILQRYCVCLIDPEGTYGALESLPGVIVLNADDDGLPLDQIEMALRYPDVSVVVNLCKLSHHGKRAGVAALLQRIATLRWQTGMPHRVVVDEAHYFLRHPEVTGQLDLDHGEYVLISSRASELDPELLSSAEALLVTKESDATEAEELRRLAAPDWSPHAFAAMLLDLEMNEALLIPGARESSGDVVRFRIASRLTHEDRYKRHYLELAVSDSAAFVFTRDGVATGQRARTLKDLSKALSAENTDSVDHHLVSGDFSRWVQSTIGDERLAAEIRSIETDWQAGRIDRPCERIARLIHDSYDYLGAGQAKSAEETESSGR